MAGRGADGGDSSSVTIAITSRTNPLLVRLRKLARDNDGYRKQRQLFLDGEHLCAAYAASNLDQPAHALVTDAAWEVPRLRALAGSAEHVAVVSPQLMATVSTLDSAPPLAFVVPWAGPGRVQAGQPSLVLDRLQDAGNAGSILRSAAAFGFGQVIAMEGTVALWSGKVVRAAMGAHFSLQLVEGADEALLDELSLPWLAASSHALLSIQQSSLPWPCAWIVGNEGQGVSHMLLRRATALRIPQPGGQESLNVAVAAALCMYESGRQRIR